MLQFRNIDSVRTY